MYHSCAFTGHRPSRFRFGYDEESPGFMELRRVLALQIENMAAAGIIHFYTGMALGIDTWAAEVVLNLRASRPDVTLTAALPCETQSFRWSVQQRDRYFDIIQRCDFVTMVSKRFTPECMFARNRWLVDHAGSLLAVYDGVPRGGTAYTVRYAAEQGCQITTIHPDTLAVACPADAPALKRRRQFRVLDSNLGNDKDKK